MSRPPIELDLRGLNCPLPVLHTRRALRRLAVGDRLTVLTTDPLAGIDIPHFVRTSGHELTDARTCDDGATFTIVKGADQR